MIVLCKSTLFFQGEATKRETWQISLKSLENKGYIIWKLDEKKERTYLVLTNKAIELSNCQKEKMIEAYEKIISNIQEDDLAVTQCTLRKIRQLMEEIK